MSDWTVILGESKPDLAGALAERSGLDVLIAGDLCNLPHEHPTVEAIRAIEGPLVVVADMYPRATYWLLRAKGVTGRRADGDRPATTGRAIYCIDTTGHADGEIHTRIVAVTGPGAGGSVTDLAEQLPARWHPVIDYDRCTSCLECVEFCLFGVYDVSDTAEAVATNPDLCKPGCPACSRVCTGVAIIFPRYHARGSIAGDDDGRPEHVAGTAALKAAAPDVRAYRKANSPQPVTLGGLAKPEASDEAGQLDNLIDELEAFDT